MIDMKMSKASYTVILEAFKANKDSIQDYIPKLKAVGGYKDFNTRLAFDCARSFLDIGWVCDLYYKEDLEDTHLKTAYVTALKEIGIL